MKVIWSEGAADDLKGISDFIAKDNPEAARRVTKAIYDRVMRLASPVFSGRKREEDTSLELVIPSLPYIVLYEVVDQAVFVKGIRHTSRDWS